MMVKLGGGVWEYSTERYSFSVVICLHKDFCLGDLHRSVVQIVLQNPPVVLKAMATLLCWLPRQMKLGSLGVFASLMP